VAIVPGYGGYVAAVADFIVTENYCG
jgi:hypothetical protein